MTSPLTQKKRARARFSPASHGPLTAPVHRSCVWDDSTVTQLESTVSEFLQSLEAQAREVASGEWGLTVDAAG